MLLAIDGVELTEARTPAMQLVGAAGRAVELTLRNGAGHGGRLRHSAVWPWFRSGRGAAAVPGMGGRTGGRPRGLRRDASAICTCPTWWPGWAQLHRDLRVEVAREGLVVDVRENRGGHTSQLVVELSAGKSRLEHAPRPAAHLPAGRAARPRRRRADEFAGSDGDIVTAVLKLRGIGPVVGTRTWGGVIGIDSRFELADGTGVTQPQYATWKPEVWGGVSRTRRRP